MGSLPVLIMMAPVLLNVADAFSMRLHHYGRYGSTEFDHRRHYTAMAPSLFVSAKVADLPFEKTLKHIYPMLVPLVVALLMVTFIKPLTLFLPGLLL